MSIDNAEFLPRINEGPRKSLTSVTERGGRSIANGGSWLGGSEVQRGRQRWHVRIRSLTRGIHGKGKKLY